MRLPATLLILLVAAPAAAQAPNEAAQREARDILTEMVSMNTSLQRGDVTPLAEKLAARFRKAGIPSADIEVVGPDAKNKNLVVRLRDTRLNRFQLRARLFQSYARFELSDDVDHRRGTTPYLGFRTDVERHVCFDFLRIAGRQLHG